MADTIDHTGALPRIAKASAYASLITGALFYVFLIAMTRGSDPIGLAYLIGFGMVAVFWVPAAIVGMVVTGIIVSIFPSKPLLPIQIGAFGAIAALGSLIGGSETIGEVAALTAIGLVFGAASTIFYQRLSKAGSTHA